MKNMKIGRRYAEAIYEIANERNKIKEIYEVLNNLMVLFKENLEFKNLLTNPLVSISEKEQFLSEIFNETEKDILNIVFYILEKDRLETIRSIVTEYLKIYYEKNSIMDVKAIFTRELTEEQKNKLIEKIEKQTNKKVNLEVAIDSSIIGGGVLKIGDRVIDGSIKKDLENWKRRK